MFNIESTTNFMYNHDYGCLVQTVDGIERGRISINFQDLYVLYNKLGKMLIAEEK
jgi:hypothetical protein